MTFSALQSRGYCRRSQLQSRARVVRHGVCATPVNRALLGDVCARARGGHSGRRALHLSATLGASPRVEAMQRTCAAMPAQACVAPRRESRVGRRGHPVNKWRRAARFGKVGRRKLDRAQQRQRGARVDALLDGSHRREPAPLLRRFRTAPLAAAAAGLIGHGALRPLSRLRIEPWGAEGCGRGARGAWGARGVLMVRTTGWFWRVALPGCRAMAGRARRRDIRRPCTSRPAARRDAQRGVQSSETFKAQRRAKLLRDE
eukprot:3904062-Prymnesium_polylepis.1